MFVNDNLPPLNTQPYPSPQFAAQSYGYPQPYPNSQFNQNPPTPQNQTGPVKNVCQSNCMHYFVIITVFFAAIVLIGAVGILCPYLLISKVEHTAAQVPKYIFCVYCLIFGVLMIVVQFRIKIIVNLFIFIASYYHRAVFTIFLGTLAMCAYARMDTFEWIGYVVGGFIMLIGIFQIMVGCFDSEWVKVQNEKYLPKVDQTVPVKPVPGQPQAQAPADMTYRAPALMPDGPLESQSQSLPLTQTLPQTQQAPFLAQTQTLPQAQQYPSLASDSAMLASANSGYDPRRTMAAQAAQMPETQRLATAATTATVQNMLSGQGAENAAFNAFSNPQVQSLAFSAGAAAVQNPGMQAAAGQAAQNALGNAYDRIFEQ